jgi:signal transduction histidine kinase
MDAQTSQNLSCPNCHQAVSMQVRQCPHCRVDLAIAAIAAEKVITTAPFSNKITPTKPEALVPRIGELLVEKGLIQSRDLRHALEIQEKINRTGEQMLIGEILTTLGYISEQQLSAVVTEHVMQLQLALTESNRHLQEQVQNRTQQLQNALKKLAELNQIKLNFISNVSHELRTPLSLLSGYLELLTSGKMGALTADQSKAIKTSYNASQQLHHLIESLLVFSSAAKGEIPLNMATLTLDFPVGNAVVKTEPKAMTKQINFKKRLSDALPPVIADDQKITWVVEQFLDNAIKFTPQGGRVKVETGPLNGDVFVRVTDTGIGIPESRLGEIFEPFHQLDGSTTRHYEGTGLGLSLAQGIVEAHGSTIQVESYVGQGSSFSFALPAVC